MSRRATLLLVLGGDDHARRVFREEGRAYWSAALPLVLEKHGFLAFDVAGPEALEDPHVWSRHVAVLVAQLPDEIWTEDLVRRMVDSGTPVLLEGPLPPVAARAAGVRKAKTAKPQMVVVATHRRLAKRALAYGAEAGGRAIGARSRPVDRVAEMDWRAQAGVPIAEDQAAAWRAEGWQAARWWPAPGATVLAQWYRKPDGERFAAVVRQGTVTACAFGLFAVLGQHHTAEPTAGAEFRTSGRVTGLETLLLALVDHLHEQAGAPRPRVLPWPGGRRWALTVRHDFDRDIGPDAVRRTLAGHARAGTSATFYWRARHLRPERRRGRLARHAGNEALLLVARDPRHEVALHTERVWAGGEAEQEAVEAVAGTRMLGTCAHGDPTCFRFQGAANVLWAEARGMAYTELIQHAHVHPHRIPVLAPDGTIRTLRVLALPHHESFDRSTTQGDTLTEELLESAEDVRRAGGLLQVMNHPDLHQDALFAVLSALPDADRADLTAAQAADWWRRTHTADALRLAIVDGDTAEVRAAEPVEGLAVELRAPDGTVTRQVVDVEPGRPVAVAPAAVGGAAA